MPSFRLHLRCGDLLEDDLAERQIIDEVFARLGLTDVFLGRLEALDGADPDRAAVWKAAENIEFELHEVPPVDIGLEHIWYHDSEGALSNCN